MRGCCLQKAQKKYRTTIFFHGNCDIRSGLSFDGDTETVHFYLHICTFTPLHIGIIAFSSNYLSGKSPPSSLFRHQPNSRKVAFLQRLKLRPDGSGCKTAGASYPHLLRCTFLRAYGVFGGGYIIHTQISSILFCHVQYGHQATTQAAVYLRTRDTRLNCCGNYYNCSLKCFEPPVVACW